MLGFLKSKTAPAAKQSQPQPSASDMSNATTAERLTLRIKHVNFLSALQAHGVPVEQMPVTAPLCGELLVSYAFDLPDQFVMATPPLLEEAGVQPQDLMALAQRNAKGKFNAQVLKTEHEGLMSVRAGGDMEAALLVFDGFWDAHVRSHVQGDIVVAAPRRDALLIADTAVVGALDALREQALQVLTSVDDPHGLSAQLMHRVPGGWQLLDAH
jgi:hypothetical protein